MKLNIIGMENNEMNQMWRKSYGELKLVKT